MCFSAEASFVVGAALIPVGGYSLWSAWRKRPNAWGLAVLPIGFGIQQIGEGFVWLGKRSQDEDLIHSASLFYLFFALALWPFWFPFMATLWETDRRRRWILGAISLAACGWFWVLYFPILRHPELLKIEIVHHSIRYDIWALPIYRWLQGDRVLLKVLYFLCLATPFVVSTQRGGWVPGLILGGSLLATELAYHQAFISVWCFFAAVMASYIAWVFYRLPTRMGERGALAP